MEMALEAVLKRPSIVEMVKLGTSTIGELYPQDSYLASMLMPNARQENDAPLSLTSHQWGWVNATPGMEQLGQAGPYAGIKLQVS